MIDLNHQDPKHRLTGITFVLISAFVFSAFGLFVKGISADAWVIIFWRGVFAALFTMGYILWRGLWNIEWNQMGRPGIMVAIVGASGIIAFIPAYEYTTIANVSLIYAAAPLVSALIAWLWLKEKTSKAILFASLCAVGGVVLIIQDSGSNSGGGHIKGDLLAVWMTVMLATMMCIYRRYPETPAAGPAILMSSILLIPAYYFGEPFSISQKDFALSAIFGLVFAIASVTLAEGARRLSAPETALLSALEIPLAIILAIIFFNEAPTLVTIFGGVIIIFAVFVPQAQTLIKPTKDK